MLKYFRKREKRKLYRQWVERANLSPDAISREEVAEDTISIPQADKQQSPPIILYILLGVAVVVLCVGLILFFVYSG